MHNNPEFAGRWCRIIENWEVGMQTELDFSIRGCKEIQNSRRCLEIQIEYSEFGVQKLARIRNSEGEGPKNPNSREFRMDSREY